MGVIIQVADLKTVMSDAELVFYSQDDPDKQSGSSAEIDVDVVSRIVDLTEGFVSTFVKVQRDVAATNALKEIVVGLVASKLLLRREKTSPDGRKRAEMYYMQSINNLEAIRKGDKGINADNKHQEWKVARFGDTEDTDSAYSDTALSGYPGI